MKSVVIHGGSRRSQACFLEWVLIGIPVVDRGGCVVVWDIVEGEVNEVASVVVHYRKDLGLECSPVGALMEVGVGDLDELLGFDNDPLGFLVDWVHVCVRGRMTIRITQLPEMDDLVDVSRWLVDASVIVVLGPGISERFRVFDGADKCPRRRMVVTPFVEGGLIMRALGCGRRWSQFTVRLEKGTLAVSAEEDRWLCANEDEVIRLMLEGV